MKTWAKYFTMKGTALIFWRFMSFTPVASDTLTSSLPTAINSFPSPQYWQWQGQKICYQMQAPAQAPGQATDLVGNVPAIVLVHGFGASWGHWRKVIPLMAQSYRVYAIDLLGFGGSDKPSPGEPLPYSFVTWGHQIAVFCR